MRKVTLCLMFLLCVQLNANAQNARIRQHNIGSKDTSRSDVETEIRFGREVAARILGKYTLYNDNDLTRYINLVGKSLAMYSNRPEIEFTIGILDSDEINAFAAPGGYIFITRGAIDAMENEAELAGVMAHEIIHVIEKHIVKELNIHGTDLSPVSGFARLIGGATDPARVAFTRAVEKAMDILFERGYKREDEITSDTLGIILMASAGYDPEAMVGYFSKIRKTEKKETATLEKLHPSFDERIKLLKETIEKEGLKGDNYISGKERFGDILTKTK